MKFKGKSVLFVFFRFSMCLTRVFKHLLKNWLPSKALLNDRLPTCLKVFIPVRNVNFQCIFFLWLVHTESPLSNFSSYQTSILNYYSDLRKIMLHSTYFCIFGIFLRSQTSSQELEEMLHQGICLFVYETVCKMERSTV